ncbi:MAG TPA: NAD-dependent epimerase/dehydratase family protein [Pyrinomonadaceae bacterium]
MRILTIGGTRFMGPHVVRHLVSAGHEVTLFHRGETKIDLAGINQFYGDRHDLSSFAAEFNALAPDVVLDMIPYTEEDARDLMRVFKGIARRLVAISSADVYRAYGRLLRLETGTPDPVPLNEDAPLRESRYPYRARAKDADDFAYNYEKILVEQVVMSEPEHLPGTILRLPAVYGPNDAQHRLFGYLKRMDDLRPAILLEEAQSRWRWSRAFVENVADAITLAVTDERAAGRIYNVGEPEAITESDWVHAIGHAAGWDGTIVIAHKDQLPAHLLGNVDYDHQLVVDTTRIRTELGYSERISQQEALHETIDWERNHPPSEIPPLQSEYDAEDEALAKLTLRDKGVD